MARAAASPLLANVYLHYAFDLWVEAWWRKTARGDVIVVRYADDAVLGFEHREDADRFPRELRERLAKFSLELHPEKTRLIEFGRKAVTNRERRGEGKPKTFDFLGFTHWCGKGRKTGYFMVRRKTVKKRMRAKLEAIKAELRRRMHAPLARTGEWLRSVIRGYFQYHAIPRNTPGLGSFLFRLRRLWRNVIRRRGQKHQPSWERLQKLFNRWLPKPCVLHPYPHQHFEATHPRWEPYALCGRRTYVAPRWRHQW